MSNNNTNPNVMLIAANDYNTSANMLYQTYIKNMCSDNDVDNHTSTSAFVSSIVLYSLSVEIGLKALIKLEGNTSGKSHDIKKLYEKLSDDLKSRIKGKLPEDRFKAQIDSYLEENKTDFLYWRYYYEKTTTANSDFLAALAQTIIQVGKGL